MLLEEGEFGPVFKGWIHEDAKPGFGMAVAVKKLRPESFQGGEAWLVGGHQSLSWATRIKVAKDVARGLSFLHDMEIPVIRRAFHAADILLDGEFNAKLYDFGLARDGPTGDVTHVSALVMGTYGYAAPEYVATGRLTTKCDVFGFGVVLLELLSGSRAGDISRVENLMECVKPYLGDKRKLSGAMDTKLEGQYSVNGAHDVAVLAMQCLISDPKRRTHMSEVLLALEQL